MCKNRFWYKVRNFQVSFFQVGYHTKAISTFFTQKHQNSFFTAKTDKNHHEGVLGILFVEFQEFTKTSCSAKMISSSKSSSRDSSLSDLLSSLENSSLNFGYWKWGARIESNRIAKCAKCILLHRHPKLQNRFFSNSAFLARSSFSRARANFPEIRCMLYSNVQ